jgi:hypothetical protein
MIFFIQINILKINNRITWYYSNDYLPLFPPEEEPDELPEDDLPDEELPDEREGVDILPEDRCGVEILRVGVLLGVTVLVGVVLRLGVENRLSDLDGGV